MNPATFLCNRPDGVSVTELEKEVGGCVECEKRVERKEGQPQQDPKERGLEMEPGGPGPVTSMSQRNAPSSGQT